MSFCQNPTIWPQTPSWIGAHCLTDTPPSVLTRTNLEIPVPSRGSNEHREQASFWGASKGDSSALSMQRSPEHWTTQVSLLVQWTLKTAAHNGVLVAPEWSSGFLSLLESSESTDASCSFLVSLYLLPSPVSLLLWFSLPLSFPPAPQQL